MESSRGQTVGKIVMKLKVFGPDGASNPTMEQAVRRNIWVATGLISIVPVVGYFLGGLASLAAVILILVGINGDPSSASTGSTSSPAARRSMKIG